LPKSKIKKSKTKNENKKNKIGNKNKNETKFIVHNSNKEKQILKQIYYPESLAQTMDYLYK